MNLLGVTDVRVFKSDFLHLEDVDSPTFSDLTPIPKFNETTGMFEGVAEVTEADLSNAVIINPATSARNIIQPTGDFIPLTVRGHASQSVPLFQIQTSGSAPVFTISSVGMVTVGASSSSGTIQASTELILQETGDAIGIVRLRLQNRGGVNGTLIEQAGTQDLVEHVLKTLTIQRNIRLEARGGINNFAGNPEFQLGSPGDPTLVISDTASAFRRGTLIVGGNTVNAKAVFQTDSSTQGVLITRNANPTTNIGSTSIPDGLLAYNTTSHRFQFWDSGISQWVTLTVGTIITDHGGLTGLLDDDHSIYALLAGRSTNQTLNGAISTGGTLTLSSTVHATKGKILFGTSAYDELNNRLGLGTATPTQLLDVNGTAKIGVLTGLIKGTTGVLSAATAGVDYEAALGNPSINGQVLSSTTLGARSWVSLPTVITDHGGLTGLSDDDHSIYALLAGRSTNQTLNGAISAGGTLTLSSTIHATKGKILFGTSAYDELNNRLGLGIANPTNTLEVVGSIKLSTFTGLIKGTTGVLSVATAGVDYEAALGNPSVNGHVLSSTIAGVRSWVALPTVITDHGGLTGLSDDDHSIYALLAGRSTNQTLNGATTAGGTLTLSSTIHATKGKILFGTSAYDQVNNRLGLGTATPTQLLDVNGTAKIGVLTGLIKGTTGVLSAATAGVDYEAALGNPSVNGQVLSSTIAGVRSWITVTSGVTDHGALTGLSDDDHSIYALLAGRSTNQSLNGATTAGGTLTLISTFHATKGKILFGTSAYDELNNRLGLGIANPTNTLEVVGSVKLSTFTGLLKGTSGVVSVATAQVDYEAWLGNPSVSGQVLSSTTAGVRSWVAPPAGVTDHNLLNGLSADDHSQYVHLSPVSTARNILTPSSNAIRGLSLHGLGSTAGHATLLYIQGTGATAKGIGVGLNESNERLVVSFDGTISWGTGVDPRDTTLTRVGATGLILAHADGGTTNAPIIWTIRHNSSSATAFGFGITTAFQLDTTTTDNVNAADLIITWADSAHANRKAQIVGNIYDTIAREWLRVTTDGAKPSVALGGIQTFTSAILALNSTTQAFLPPRLTTTQRDAVTSLVAGLIIYNSTTNTPQFFNGSIWQNIDTNSSALTGTGTTNFISKWTSASALGNSAIFDNGTLLGWNTSTPAFDAEFVKSAAGIGFGITSYGGVGLQTLLHGRKARGTVGTPTVVQSGDLLFGVTGRGWGNAATFASTYTGAINFFAAQNFTATAQGTYFTIETTPLNSVTRLERVRIDETGGVAIGGVAASPPSALLAVTSTTRGFLLPRMTATQRDAIGSPLSGLMVLSTNTNTIFFYNGTTWMELATPAAIPQHNQLLGLSADDHTQYALLAGRAGGQILNGGTASGNSLTLISTTNATKGKIFFGTLSAYNQVDDTLGLGVITVDSSIKLHVAGSGLFAGTFNNAATRAGGYLGLVGTVPTLMLRDTSNSWVIDQASNELRMGVVGTVHAQLSSTRLLLSGTKFIEKGDLAADPTAPAAGRGNWYSKGGHAYFQSPTFAYDLVTWKRTTPAAQNPTLETGTIGDFVIIGSPPTTPTLAALVTLDVRGQGSFVGDFVAPNVASGAALNVTRIATGSQFITITRAFSTTWSIGFQPAANEFSIGPANSAATDASWNPLFRITSNGRMAIGGAFTTTTQAGVEFNFTDKAILLPRINTPTSIIASPVAGLLAYNSSSPTAGTIQFYDGTAWRTLVTSAGVTDHNSLSNLTVGDPHTQYVYWNGRTGDQYITGSIDSGGNLVLVSTSHATKGSVFVGNSIFDQQTNRVGINTFSPQYNLHVVGTIKLGTFTGIIRADDGVLSVDTTSTVSIWNRNDDNQLLSPTNINDQVSIGIARRLGTSPSSLIPSLNMLASPQMGSFGGLISLGDFQYVGGGASSNYFVGIATGTYLAINGFSGGTSNLIDVRQANAKVLTVSPLGFVQIGGTAGQSANADELRLYERTIAVVNATKPILDVPDGSVALAAAPVKNFKVRVSGTEYYVRLWPVSGGGGGGGSVSDTYTRGSYPANLSGSTSTTGSGTWTARDGGSAAVQVATDGAGGGLIQRGTLSGQYGVCTLSNQTANGTIRITVKGLGTGNTSCGLAVRYDTTTHQAYLIHFNSSSIALFGWDVDGGVAVSGSTNQTTSWTLAVNDIFEIVISGDTYTIKAKHSADPSFTTLATIATVALNTSSINHGVLFSWNASVVGFTMDDYEFTAA